MSIHSATMEDKQFDSPSKDAFSVELVETASKETQSGLDHKATRKLVRKIDWALLPLLSILYLLSFLDRTNIGNARLAGLEKDLGMKGLDYNVAVAVFFPLYVLAEVPSNMLLKRLRPSLWIPTIMVAWGVCCTLTGLSKNFSGLVAARIFLGLIESGLFPGINFYITMWYVRRECGFRMSIFFSAATASGAFGGLLARAIVEMDGVGGLSGWSWIFIIEGLITVVTAVIAYFAIYDHPSTAKFLTQPEKDEVTRRLEQDRGDLADEFDLKYCWDAIKDWKVWTHALMSFCIAIGLYCVAIFLPTIVKTLGYTDNTAQLMSVPPYVVACLICLATGWAADRLQTRGIFVIALSLVAITGMIIMLVSTNTSAKYFACFLVTTGVLANIPMTIAWVGNNIGGTMKRGVGIAIQIALGNLTGVVGSFIFLSKDAPRFLPGYLVLICLTFGGTIISLFLTLYYRAENARRDRKYKSPSTYTQAERLLEREKGDKATFFRFTV